MLVVGGLALGYALSAGRYGLLLPAGVALLGGIAGLLSWGIDIPGRFQLKDAVAFSALFLVLVFRPAGFLGERLALEDRA